MNDPQSGHSLPPRELVLEVAEHALGTGVVQAAFLSRRHALDDALAPEPPAPDGVLVLPAHVAVEDRPCAPGHSRGQPVEQQELLLDRLLERMPEGARPVLHSDMGWQYQHEKWTRRLKRAEVTQSMSRKGNCLDNGATEQVFGHLKDEFFRGRSWPDFESFKADLDAYVIHWNTRRRQVKLNGLTPEEFRSQSRVA